MTTNQYLLHTRRLYRICNGYDKIRIELGKSLLAKKYFNKAKAEDMDIRKFIALGTNKCTQWLACCKFFSAIYEQRYFYECNDDDYLVVINYELLVERNHTSIWQAHSYEEFENDSWFRVKYFSSASKEVDLWGEIPAYAYTAVKIGDLRAKYDEIDKAHSSRSCFLNEHQKWMLALSYCLN